MALVILPVERGDVDETTSRTQLVTSMSAAVLSVAKIIHKNVKIENCQLQPSMQQQTTAPSSTPTKQERETQAVVQVSQTGKHGVFNVDVSEGGTVGGECYGSAE